MTSWRVILRAQTPTSTEDHALEQYHKRTFPAIMTVQKVQLNAEEIFQKQWLTYQTLLREDYLEHRTLYEAVQGIILDRARQFPQRILDLGCGDSDYIARALAAAGGASIVESYTGVDLSEPALAISERNIQRALGSKEKATWHHSDFVSFSDSCQEDFDVVLMSFSLHHLPEPAKGGLLREAQRLLSRRAGCFVIVDIFRQPNESLPQYHERQQEEVTSMWTALSTEERGRLTDHMLKFDMPETEATTEALGKAAGFASVDTVKQAKNKLAVVVLLKV